MPNAVLLSGGTGFVGQPLRELLFKANIPVRLILRKPISLNKNETAIYTQDLFNENTLFFQKALENIHTVIHLAWYTEHGKYQYSSLNEQCAKITFNFAQTALQQNIQHFIGTGTCFEYQILNQPMDIHTPLAPKTPYGKAKAECYTQLNHLFKNSNTRFSWARLFYLYGANENPNRLIPYIHQCLKNKQKIQIKNLKCVRDFLNTQEVAKKLIDLLRSHPKKNSAYNICSGKGISIENYVKMIAEHDYSPNLLDLSHSHQNLNHEPPYIVGIPTEIPQ